VGFVTDILVRDVPDDVIAAIESRAAALGLSRSEFLRRRLAQEVVDTDPVTVEDFAVFTETFGDLADPEVMGGAWS
jgi:hypothetical protein